MTLISSAKLAPPAGVDVVAVETTEQLLVASLEQAVDADLVIMAAAVADFRPVKVASEKLKRRDGLPEFVL